MRVIDSKPVERATDDLADDLDTNFGYGSNNIADGVNRLRADTYEHFDPIKARNIDASGVFGFAPLLVVLKLTHSFLRGFRIKRLFVIRHGSPELRSISILRCHRLMRCKCDSKRDV